MTIERRDESTGFGRTETKVVVPVRARKHVRRLEEVVTSTRGGKLELSRGDERVEVPSQFIELLRVAAQAVDSGDAVTVVVGDPAQDRSGDDKELSSQDAADLLNVSRPHVVKLARDGVLPHRKVGNRHRFRQADVLAYRERASHERSQALAALAPAAGYRPEDF